jgi:Cu(I)/Ag(I) efflux system membrane fusion protein/cobalt-zinc-cadmium efflux system membrane fusion protein
MTKFPKKPRLVGFSIILVLASAFLFAACKKSPRAQTPSSVQVADASQAGAGSQQAAPKPKLYRCPMHPTFTSDKPGSCGICGMALVPVEEEETTPQAPPASQAQPAPKKKTMYRSTMNPNEISDKPGKDSMGMEMVPFEVEEAGPSAVRGRVAVRISPERQQLIGVRTAIVKRQDIHKLVRAVGRVDYAEPNISLVTLKFEGWIERLFVNSTGRLVRRGEALFEIYSPDLVSAQQEYLLALKAREITGISGLSVLASAREKLKLWDITEQQVEHLERTGEIKRTLTIFAPISGFVIEKAVLLGQKVRPGENLYKIADLSSVWVLGDIYEYELPFVKKGQDVMISLSYFPGETFSGEITYIYPYLNAETRTIRVRVEVKNPEFKLKPEMYANLEVDVDYGTKLAIPADAVLDAGVKNVTFVDKGDGYFEPQEVKLGVKGEGVYEVLAGVTDGEKVVTSANFLVDSESSLKAALQQMTQAEPQSKQPEPKHD